LGGHAERGSFAAAYIDHLETFSLECLDRPAPSPAARFLGEHRYGPDFLTPVPPQGISRYPNIRPEE
jgi:hypothetical protein